jgi:hypothetical protein
MNRLPINPLFVDWRRIFFTILAASLAAVLLSAVTFAQSSSSQSSSSGSGSQPSSSQQSSGQTQAPSQTQSGASIDPPAQKQESLGDAARKAKANKPSAAKPKVYTEDDLSGMKGPGVSVVGSSSRKRSPNANPGEGDGDYAGPNTEEYWRSQARQILDAIAATDEAIEQKKEEIKKYGSGGFDVQTGRQQNIAYINDREGQLKQLEKHKADLQKQLDDLADEGRKAGASPAWFR